MRLTFSGWRRQGALPAVMVGACAVLAACGLAGGELTQPDDTAAQTIDSTETTQTTLNPTGTTQTTADPTETTLKPTGTTQTTIGAPTTTQTTAAPTGTAQTTIGSTATEVTLAPDDTPQTGVTLPPGVTEKPKGRFPWMVEAPGGFVVGDPGAENAVELGDAKEMLEYGALAIAYEFWRLVDEPGTPCPAHRLRVSWEGPDHVFGPDADVQHWSYIPPLGPPRAGEDRAAGIVYCKGSHYAFMGFEAFWESGPKAWAVYPIPQG